MNTIKTIFVAVTLFIASSAFASGLKAEVIEHCSHDIMNLVKQNKLLPEAVSKLHMMRVTELAEGFQVIAVLDHNENHDSTPAHIKFKYGADAKMISFEYFPGYFNPNPTPFNKKSSAKLFDIAAELLIDSDDMTLREYAKDVQMIHLRFDETRKAVLFEMIDVNKKELYLWMDLDGNSIEVSF